MSDPDTVMTRVFQHVGLEWKLDAEPANDHGNGSNEQLKKRTLADQSENSAKKTKLDVNDAEKTGQSEVIKLD
jgi:hypothetical protein